MPRYALGVARIAIFGAGAIGCWVGGRIASSAEVTLIGRPRVIDELARGLRVRELDGREFFCEPKLATEIRGEFDLIVVTVKSAATAEAARAVKKISAPVLSLQNGVRNVQVLRDALPDRRVLAGMVPFNVVRTAPGEYQRASAGTIAVEPAAAIFGQAARGAGLPLELRDDMLAVQWSKLVMNLNNAINALSGLPLGAELASRDFRRCLAAAMTEALDLIEAAETPIARVTLLPPRWIARMLPAPDAIFRAVAGRVVAIDPRARSSMWDDLEAKRATEIDYLQGEIITLAARLGRSAPVNTALAALVRAAEAGGKRDFTGAELLAAITRPTA